MPAPRPHPADPPGAGTREEIREYDRAAIQDFGLPGVVLMENAGRETAAAIQDLLAGDPTGKPVIFLCGSGNNGGDGYVAARHLQIAGGDPRIWRVGREPRAGGDAAVNLAVARRLGLPVLELTDPETARKGLSGAALVVDALFGTGLTGPVRSPAREIIEILNSRSGPVLAVDIPSGLDANTGEILGVAVTADETITFVKPKTGFFQESGPVCTGRIRAVGIGMPRPLPPA